ncbi:hypothetical protein [Pontitalea aquivivens]|uniref:hypothetical protein n=1 Tax=Pontitalea aquivivens TaxID=3388663 RepID=UPI0039710DD8
MPAEFPLNEAQLQELSKFTNGGTSNFHKGYAYALQQMKAYYANPVHAEDPNRQEHAKIMFWLEKAAEINRNDPGSQSNFFMRDFTRTGRLYDGKDASPEKIQENSDLIGKTVIRDVIQKSRIPSIEKLIQNDVSTAIEHGGQTIGGWGGNSYLWNMPLSGDPENTVGKAILGNPAEYEKFIAINAKVLRDVLGEFGPNLEQVETFLGSELPLSVAGDIMDRVAKSKLGIEKLAGDPDLIDGYLAVEGLDGTIEWRSITAWARPPVSDPAKIDELNRRRQIRIEKGKDESWQKGEVSQQDAVIKTAAGTSYEIHHAVDGQRASLKVICSGLPT